MMPNPPVPCEWCQTLTKAYDTEPWGNELTFAYECECGHTWTKDMDHLLPA